MSRSPGRRSDRDITEVWSLTAPPVFYGTKEFTMSKKASHDFRRGSVNENYKYAGTSLTEGIARELIIEVFAGKTSIKKKEIKRVIDETHTARGGSLSTNEVHPVSNALSIMKKKGLAKNPSRGKWSIFSKADGSANVYVNSDTVRILGSGEKSVYLYYYPVYRCLAAYQDKHFWQCKIEQSISDIPPGMPEPPEISFIFRTDDSENLKQVIHNVLKLRGKHISDARGGKWFLTSPSEVESIYKNVIGIAEK